MLELSALPHLKHGTTYLFQDHLELSLIAELVLAPSGGDALVPVVAAVAVVRAARHADLVQAPAEDERGLGEDEGDVRGEVLLVESRVDRHFGDGSVLVRDRLHNSPGVPLAAPHDQVRGPTLVVVFPVNGAFFSSSATSF